MVYTLRFLLFKMQFVSFLTYLVPVLFTFYIQSVLILKKKNNSGAKSLNGFRPESTLVDVTSNTFYT